MKIIQLVVGLLLATCFTGAYNLKKQYPTAPGKLGVKLDYQVALGGEPAKLVSGKINVVLTSYLEFKGDVSVVSDAQLLQIAKDAWNEMREARNQYQLGHSQYASKVMSLLAVGNEIFLASSQKGGSSVIDIFPDSPARLALQRCKVASGNNEHKFERRCGEILAIHMYFKMHNNMPLNGLNARIVAIEQTAKGLAVKAPCGDKEVSLLVRI